MLSRISTACPGLIPLKLYVVSPTIDWKAFCASNLEVYSLAHFVTLFLRCTKVFTYVLHASTVAFMFAVNTPLILSL